MYNINLILYIYFILLILSFSGLRSVRRFPATSAITTPARTRTTTSTTPRTPAMAISRRWGRTRISASPAARSPRALKWCPSPRNRPSPSWWWERSVPRRCGRTPQRTPAAPAVRKPLLSSGPPAAGSFSSQAVS